MLEESSIVKVMRQWSEKRGGCVVQFEKVMFESGLECAKVMSIAEGCAFVVALCGNLVGDPSLRKPGKHSVER